MGLFDLLFKKKKAPAENTPIVDVSASVPVSPPRPPTQAELDDQVIPVEDRIKQATANKHGLYPHEVLVLDYAPTFYTDGNAFQGFWWYRYGVRDVQAVLRSLTERGFLQIGDLRAALEKQNATTIKEALRAHGCKQTGKKDELVQRALDEIPAAALDELFPKRTYQPTDTGKAALDEDAYVPYIHRHGYGGLDIWSLNQLVHTEPYMSYRDKVWGYLNQCSMEHAKERNMGAYRNRRYDMSQFLLEEGKLKDALAMLAEVVFYDVSGATCVVFDHGIFEFMGYDLFNYEKTPVMIAPRVIVEIADCQKKLEYNDDELRAALVERMSKMTTPIQLFTAEECASIALMERDGNKDGLTLLYAKAQKAFIKKYPNIKL